MSTLTAGDDPGENVSWEFFATDISYTNDDWMEYYGDWMEYDVDLISNKFWFNET